MRTIKSDEVGSVGEAMLEENLKKNGGGFVGTVRHMKSISSAGKTAREKHRVGSCVDPECQKPGEPMELSDLEVEVQNLFHLAGQIDHKKVPLNNPTNILLELLFKWENIAGELSRRNKIPGKELFDPKGNAKIKTPWIIIGLSYFYENFTKNRYGDQGDREFQRRARNSVSSLVTRIFKSLTTLGLASEDDSMKSEKTPTKCYVLWKNKFSKLTFEQFCYLYRAGYVLQEKVGKGEFVRKKHKKAKPEKIGKQMIILSGNDKHIRITFKENPKTIKSNILPNGKISLEIIFR